LCVELVSAGAGARAVMRINSGNGRLSRKW
jgi:hypothetical protein